MKMKFPIVYFGDIYETFEYLKSLNITIDRHYASEYHVYEFSNSLSLYTDYNDNIIFDITLETNERNKRVKNLMNKDTTIIQGYINFIEKLERRSKIKNLLKC